MVFSSCLGYDGGEDIRASGDQAVAVAACGGRAPD